MMKKDSQKKFGISGSNHRKLADKRSVFASDFIGREGKINPRTLKEIIAVTCLCGLLAFVFYANFYNKAQRAAKKQDSVAVSADMLEEITFRSSWKRPEAASMANIINPMLSLNKLLSYQQKTQVQPQLAAQDEPAQPVEQPQQEETQSLNFKKIKIQVKGILWNPNGASTALIDREMLKENQNYLGYTIAKVLRRSVVLTDANGNSLTLNVGENKEVIASVF